MGATSTSALEALRTGRAFVDVSSWRKVLVRGSDGRRWLNDLLTADISDLGPRRASRSLLLSPTGRIRADVTIAGVDDGLLLVQDPVQPSQIDRLLAPYVLSSDVELLDRTEALGLLAFPGGRSPITDGRAYEPSCLGIGTDVVVAIDALATLRAAAHDLEEAGSAAVDAWRVERGAARFGVDLGDSSLPHEAGLDTVIGYEKGCFLGQEAVAKVRNLGHPPFAVLGARAEGVVSVDDEVLSEQVVVGGVTSAAEIAPGRTAVIARVRWQARDAPLATSSGVPLVSLGLASGSG